MDWGSERERRAQMEALWPRDATGEREEAVLLTYVPDFQYEADLALNLLQAYGIPAYKSYNNEGSLGKLLLGSSAYSPALYVPRSMAEDARALLESSAEDSDEPDEET